MPTLEGGVSPDFRCRKWIRGETGRMHFRSGFKNKGEKGRMDFMVVVSTELGKGEGTKVDGHFKAQLTFQSTILPS
jgi:hypothetical protein